MSGRSIRAGQAIKLRAQFKDDLGDEAPATSVFVHVFDPDGDIADLGDALVVSGIPSYLGEGIYEYEYTPPTVGPDGTWYDTPLFFPVRRPKRRPPRRSSSRGNDDTLFN